MAKKNRFGFINKQTNIIDRYVERLLTEFRREANNYNIYTGYL